MDFFMLLTVGKTHLGRDKIVKPDFLFRRFPIQNFLASQNWHRANWMYLFSVYLYGSTLYIT